MLYSSTIIYAENDKTTNLVKLMVNTSGHSVESKRRTLVKSLSFRLVALTITAPIIGFNTALGIQVLLFFAYYIHERLWLRVRWH